MFWQIIDFLCSNRAVLISCRSSFFNTSFYHRTIKLGIFAKLRSSNNNDVVVVVDDEVDDDDVVW